MRAYPVSPRQQSGVALIVVLMFLILIMIAGAIAVRQSRTDLRVATVDQANTLTLNSSDSVLAHIEQAATDKNNAGRASIYSDTGILGYFLVQPATKIGQQISFCYRPTLAEAMYKRSAALTRYLGGGTNGSNDAICDPVHAKDYTSGRNVAMTQITIHGVESGSSDNFENSQTGTSEDRKLALISPTININSTSVLPGMSDVKSDEIKECLNRPVGDSRLYSSKGESNMSSCLKERSIPATALVQEALVTNEHEGGFDPKTGAINSPAIVMPTP